MLAVLPIIASAFASIIAFIIKHPFVSKMMIFAMFTALITLSVSYMQDIVSPYIVGNSLLSLSAYFGIIDGISLYLTIVLSGFGAKQILAFIRS